jgi:TolA-binding protein
VALLVSGCAGAEASLRREVDTLRTELALARQENQQLQHSVDVLSARVEAITARLAHPPAEARLAERTPEPRPMEPAAPVVPGGLAVVRMEPPTRHLPAAPPVPVAVAIVEPAAGRVDALARRSGRDLAADAEVELKAARRRDGLARAHGLEDFVARYPRHPQADNALLEAAAAYADAGRADAACTLVRRSVEEYPAGDALAEALWRQALCEARSGASEAERKALTRLTRDFPSTPAGRRAGERLAAISGRSGGESPPDAPARSSP